MITRSLVIQLDGVEALQLPAYPGCWICKVSRKPDDFVPKGIYIVQFGDAYRRVCKLHFDQFHSNRIVAVKVSPDLFTIWEEDEAGSKEVIGGAADELEAIKLAREFARRRGCVFVGVRDETLLRKVFVPALDGSRK